jgi:hypothetical protein
MMKRKRKSSRISIELIGGKCMSYTIMVDYSIKVTVAYTDQYGNPAVIDGDVIWASSDDTIVQVFTESGNSLNAMVKAQTKTGQAQVTATADADLGEGVRSLVTLMDVSVVAGEAVAGTITPQGDPIPPA